jgi:predicted nucleotidyltransferase component of viral defense system
LIPKARLLEFAARYGLLPTTIEKDYVLGCLLAGISQHEHLSQWVFKGGTCLKKCYFETYRFSEDLDFTIPASLSISIDSIKTAIQSLLRSVEADTGLQFPLDGVTLEQYTNPRSNDSFQARITYVGPLDLPRKSLQRVKFDLTQDELLASSPDLRPLFHPYGDLDPSVSRVRCYSVDEILAEKSRALYERQGRARDVYDIIHLTRDFRESIDPTRTAELAVRKFQFKGLPSPTVDLILQRIETSTLRADWEQQLRHQVPHLPPVDGFLDDLPGALAWWLEPAHAPVELKPIAVGAGERPVPRQHFPTPSPIPDRAALAGQVPAGMGGALEQVRIAARNRLCAEIVYRGVTRLVEPYSLRHPSTGNTLLYAFELSRAGRSTEQVKAYNIVEVKTARITDRPFTPRFLVEL